MPLPCCLSSRSVVGALTSRCSYSVRAQSSSLPMSRLRSMRPSSVPSALSISLRNFARPSTVNGPITSPPGGFVTEDIRLDMNASFGGAYARGVFANSEIGYGREIMNIPAYCMYIPDRPDMPLRAQVLALTKQIFTKLVCGTQEEKSYIQNRLMSLMSGGFTYFAREKDVFDFAEDVRAPGSAGALQNGTIFLTSGEFSSYDLQKLPLILELNRFDVEYRGRRGICIFPEASYFNHTCEANVQLEISYNRTKENFYLSARAVRPIREGEELYINYMPGNNLPLSRLAMAMKLRWGFECTCMRCKSRGIGVVVMLSVLVLLPMAVYSRFIYASRSDAKKHNLQ